MVRGRKHVSAVSLELTCVSSRHFRVVTGFHGHSLALGERITSRGKHIRDTCM